MAVKLESEYYKYETYVTQYKQVHVIYKALRQAAIASSP